MSNVSIQGLRELNEALERMNSPLMSRREFNLWLEALAFQFLEEIQREIIRTRTVDTRRLLNSFMKGSSDNVWTITERGLTLEVGTNVEYAAYANSGHNQRRRWVPGRWHGSGENAWFEYIPGYDKGMMLTARWVEGTH
jgi:hypothetical protein